MEASDKKEITPLTRAYLKLKARFPHELPRNSMKEMEEFSSLILKTYDIPDYDSYRSAIAMMIQQLSPLCTRIPLTYFGRSIHKARANELAFGVIQDIRQKEKERAAAKLKQPGGEENAVTEESRGVEAPG